MKRLLQIFLSPTDSPSALVSEVSIDLDTDTLSCTCPGFRGRASCKHTKEVQDRIHTNGGTYPMEVSNRATKEDAKEAEKTEESFRKFVVKFGKIEVL